EAQLVQIGEHLQDLGGRLAQLGLGERAASDARRERLALDELGGEVEPQLDALAFLEAGDEARDARVVQRLERRGFALERVDLLRAGNGGELELLERDDGAVRRGGAVDAAAGALAEDALDAVAAGGEGDAAEGAARGGAGTAATWTSGRHCWLFPLRFDLGRSVEVLRGRGGEGSGYGRGWSDPPGGTTGSTAAARPGRGASTRANASAPPSSGSPSSLSTLPRRTSSRSARASSSDGSRNRARSRCSAAKPRFPCRR